METEARLVACGVNGKREDRGSVCRISRARGVMGECVEEDTGLWKALVVLCLRHLNIFLVEGKEPVEREKLKT